MPREKKKRAPSHPLAEVFGFPHSCNTPEAQRFRDNRLCPFNNKVPSCTKDKFNDPLGVCSVFDGNEGDIAITCPIRFRENWLITEHSSSFFFPSGTKWTTLTEVRLNDKDGNAAGNIDIVLVSYDDRGKLIDFGALEVQAVYISGNIRRPFEAFMADQQNGSKLDWRHEIHYPRADYLSSSRKRLVPQLIYKGSILHSWGKRMAVALHRSFFETLPRFRSIGPKQASIAWLIYDLVPDPKTKRLTMKKLRTVYTGFKPALKKITTPKAGLLASFHSVLQAKLDEQLSSSAPDAPTLADLPLE